MTPLLTDWVSSPDPDVESAIARIAAICPVNYVGGLERIQAFLPKIGNPHHRLPPTFHVAGTNGKGSTLAFLQAIFEAGGKRVHKYISPHLVRFEERIVLSGQMIERDLFLSLIRECETAAQGMDISFFEFFTALALLAFSRTPADVLLLETGLGGRLDATNVIENNVVSIITRISFDHTHVLGDTLTAIAGEKAGIIKPRCPVVVAAQTSPDVTDVFMQASMRAPAPMFYQGKDWDVSAADGGFVYRGGGLQFDLPSPALPGQHQVVNAGAAIAAVQHSEFSDILRLPVVCRAMETVVWPGRLQRLTHGTLASMLPDGWELWVDGAHNDSGAEVLADYLARAPKPTHLVTMMKDGKDALTFFKTLRPHVLSASAVNIDLHVKMLGSDELCDYMTRAGIPAVFAAPDARAAVSGLISRFKTPQRVVIAGSLYLAGYVLRDNN